jgi:hypothetical protein
MCWVRLHLSSCVLYQYSFSLICVWLVLGYPCFSFCTIHSFVLQNCSVIVILRVLVHAQSSKNESVLSLD